MTRIAQHLLGGTLLDEAPGVEHADAVAHLRDHAEVVADEQHRGAKLGLQGLDQIEHLRLDRRVEPGRRFVEDQQRGIVGKRHRDHHALLHATGELVREAFHHPAHIRDLHLLEHRVRTRVRVTPCNTTCRVDLRHLPADAHAGVERGARILVDHRDRVGSVAS